MKKRGANHNNSHKNDADHHLYEFYDQQEKETFKYGISCEPIGEDGLSKRMRRQLEIFNLAAGWVRYIVHIEFQTKMPRAMVYRVAEYHGFLLAKYKLPIRHFVVYLGKSQTKAPTELPKDLQFSGYKLITLNQIPFEKLIQSKIPEEIILAIFAHYPKHDPERVARIILYRLKEVCKDEASLRKFITQLTFLSQLRKLDGYVKQIADSMPITIDLRENALVKDLIAEVQAEWELEYAEKLKAIEQVAASEKTERLQAEQDRLQAEQTIKNTILHLHQQLQLPAEQIASIMQLDLDEVLQLINSINNIAED